MSTQDPGIDATTTVASCGGQPSFRRAGSFVFVSGVRAASDNAADIRVQTKACIETLSRILEDADGGLENLVEVTTYLARMTDFAGYNEAYSKFFSVDGPARTTVAVDRLTHPKALIEMRGVAYIAENANAKS